MSKQADAGRPEQPDRRQFLTGGALASGAMAGGLALGYGMFFRCAGEYLYPSEEGRAWMFVTNVAGVAPGQAVSFQSPTGVPVVITRKREGEAPAEPNTANAQSPSESLAAPTAADFLALSSVCPHLGCRVHWEPQNDRFFCPCHLGTFDPEGRPTGGPPLAANQSLPEYPLRVENGLLYINMPIKPIDQTTYRVVQADAERAGASSPPTGAEDRPARFDSETMPRRGGVA
jgi:Rieske Fe-S protein